MCREYVQGHLQIMAQTRLSRTPMYTKHYEAPNFSKLQNPDHMQRSESGQPRRAGLRILMSFWLWTGLGNFVGQFVGQFVGFVTFVLGRPVAVEGQGLRGSSETATPGIGRHLNTQSNVKGHHGHHGHHFDTARQLLGSC